MRHEMPDTQAPNAGRSARKVGLKGQQQEYVHERRSRGDDPRWQYGPHEPYACLAGQPLLVAAYGLRRSELLQASFTGFCPAAVVFRKLGLKSGPAFNCPAVPTR